MAACTRVYAIWLAAGWLLGACSSDGVHRRELDRGMQVADDGAAQSAERAPSATELDGGARPTDARAADPGPLVTRDAQTEDAGAVPPSPRGSCYGRCGLPELLAVTGECACDVGCFTRGDCCADKHELCSVSARSPLCTLTGSAVDPRACGSDLGWSFVHGERVEVLFGDTYDRNCGVPLLYDDAQGTLPRERPALLPRTLPSAPVACTGLLELDALPTPRGDSFAPIRLFDGASALSSALGETPLTGFSDGSHAYMIARRGSTVSEPVLIAVRDPSVAPDLQPARTVYRVLAKDASPHLRNPVAATVAHYDPSSPVRDWGPGHHSLFVFGRDDFGGEVSRKVYLAHHPLPLLGPAGDARWQPLYFAGMEAGKPVWTPDPRAAHAIVERDFSLPMQLEVAWVPALAKWVMLYGGDVADWLDASANDQPRHGALHLRLADDPWGPWSAATPAFFREHAAAFLHCDAPAHAPRSGCDLDELPDDPDHTYAPGSWGAQVRGFPGCISAELTPSQPRFIPGSFLPCLGAQRGNLYAPSLLESWTADLAGDQGYPHAATLYFLVSTWMPYQVILAALTLHLP